MSWSWERRIARASELRSRFPESAGVLVFYSHIARYQKTIADRLSFQPATDPLVLMSCFSGLFELVDREGPPELSNYAREQLKASSAQEELLADCWSGNPPNGEAAKFFGRALLQPFAEGLARRGKPEKQSTESRCPFCNSPPVTGVLRGEGEGAKRSLICSLCATEWQFRRIVCPGCGEEDRDRLPVYLAETIDFVRVDACDTCRTYIKSVDLTKDGHAVPVVDEMATLALTVWAEEHGYSKVETNLLGM